MKTAVPLVNTSLVLCSLYVLGLWSMIGNFQPQITSEFLTVRPRNQDM